MLLSDLLPAIPTALSDQLRSRINVLRSKLVKANYHTQFARTAPELAYFRLATAGNVDDMDDDSLREAFCNTVLLTDYSSYAPLTAKILEKPCKGSAIVDLFAPGLPDCLVESSSTSSGICKTFVVYNTLSRIKSSNAELPTVHDQDSLPRRTKLILYYLEYNQMTVLDEDDCPAATIYVTSGSVVKARTSLCLDVDGDAERMGKFILDQAVPYAAAFINKWPSFLLIHSLFALRSRSLETMSMVFLNTFVDMMQNLDVQFEMIVDCIANGTIPDLEGITEVRHYLEMNVSPDPERAEELRRLGRPSARPAWCAHIWPHLRSVTGISSGPFASALPVVQRMLGPDIEIRSPGYGSTEAWIGSPYNPLELNQFKLCDTSVFELLDIRKADSISAIAQLWEAKLGNRYELILTTTNGLWRYRLGDVVEISGFDPADGTPVIQFIERRNVVLRFPDFMVSETELRLAMSSMASITLVNWTAAIDEQYMPATITFFVELAGGPGVDDFSHVIPDLVVARDGIFDTLLQSNANIAWALKHDKFRRPVVRIVRPGTFSEFLQLKLDVAGHNVGQVKVPVALPKAEYLAWFLERVVHEL